MAMASSVVRAVAAVAGITASTILRTSLHRAACVAAAGSEWAEGPMATALAKVSAADFPAAGDAGVAAGAKALADLAAVSAADLEVVPVVDAANGCSIRPNSRSCC
ncbi:hypothetical protein [Novosphingobium sp.]|uniref:hypothetical protein n=1 Tax=Novosphingobium sp. TaxID=1874826 RepID=UPI0025FCEE31|nr:hypothetical protein [Novosphingobium sp.]